jgi:type I restriction enzyme M protein
MNKEKKQKDALTKSDIKRVCDILRRDDGVGAKDYIEQFSWLLFLKVFEGVEGQLKELEEAEGKKYKPVIDKEYQWSSWATKDWKDKDELIHFINQKLFPYLKALKGDSKKDKIGEIFRELSGNRIRSPHNLLDVVEILDKIEKHHFQDTHLLSQVYEEILQAMGSEGGWSGEFYTPRPIIRLMVKIVDPKIGETIFDPFVGSGGFLVESFNQLYENSAKDVRAWRTLQTKTFYGQEKKPLPFLIGTMNLILHHILVPNLTRSNTFMEDVHNMPESAKMDVILTNPPFGAEETEAVQNNFPIKVSATEGLALQYIMKRIKNGGRCGVILPDLNIMFGGGAMARIREELLSKFNVHSIISLPQGAFSQMGTNIKTNLIFFNKTGSTKEIWYGEVKGKFTKTKTIQDEHFEEVFKKWTKRELSDTSWIVSIDDIKKRGYDLTPRNPILTSIDAQLPPEEIINEIKNCQQEIDKEISSIRNSLSAQGAVAKDFQMVELGKVLDYEQPTKYIVSSVDYNDKNVTPVLTAGKTFILGYTNEKKGIFEEKLPVIIFDDFTTAIKFVDFPFKVKSSAMKILLADTKKANIKYLFNVMQSIVFPVRKHKRHWISEYSKIKIPLPSLLEQERITGELEKVFASSQKLNELLEKQKMSVTSLRSSSLNRSFPEQI